MSNTQAHPYNANHSIRDATNGLMGREEDNNLTGIGFYLYKYRTYSIST